MDYFINKFFYFLGASVIYFPLTGALSYGLFWTVKSTKWPHIAKMLFSSAIVAIVLGILRFDTYEQINIGLWFLIGAFWWQPKSSPASNPSHDSTIMYFAYGSNMLEDRLRAANRVPGAVFTNVVNISTYTLRFHKRSDDGSGKANIVRTQSPGDTVYGVAFAIPEKQLAALDKAEGLGHGYHHEYLAVRLSNGTEESMLSYVADSSAIDESLTPYSWYRSLVIAGAEQHCLPEAYIAALKAVPSCEDPNPNRATKLEAEQALSVWFNSDQRNQADGCQNRER